MIDVLELDRLEERRHRCDQQPQTPAAEVEGPHSARRATIAFSTPAPLVENDDGTQESLPAIKLDPP